MDRQSQSGPDASSSGDLVAALLELARSAAEDALSGVLESVANAVLVTTGYRTVVLNVFRPAWDDFEVILVLGGQESVDTLMGSTGPRDTIDALLAEGDEILPGVHLVTGDTPVWDQFDRVYTPDIPLRTEPGAWQPEDALLVMLREANGEPLGFVSVDEPATGRRPTKADLQLLRVVCTYAEQALRSAQRAHRAEQEKQLLERLSGLSPLLSRCRSFDELYCLVTMVVTSNLGFERVALYTTQNSQDLVLSQSRGWEPPDGLVASLDRAHLESLLVPWREEAGCWLVRASELDRASDHLSQRSRLNGVGPLAWSDHALLVPWHTESEALAGVLVIEDPVDRLLPTVERRRAARLLTDLAASVARSVAQQERLVQQASYDPLTGLRNRRGLHRLITDSASVVLLLCDIDHFKQVNDEYGHELGDRVLQGFGALLTELTTTTGVAVRLGGEEFCVVLSNAAEPDAVNLAERLRELTLLRTREIVPDGVTVSVGIASSAVPVPDANVLLAAADRGLYEAKRSGRNRVVIAAES